MEYLKSLKLFKHVFDNRIEYHNDKGQRHRENGPAIEYINGNKYWYLNGKCHREDGPAIDLNDKLHREDGPAVEWNNGEKRMVFE